MCTTFIALYKLVSFCQAKRLKARLPQVVFDFFIPTVFKRMAGKYGYFVFRGFSL